MTLAPFVGLPWRLWGDKKTLLCLMTAALGVVYPLLCLGVSNKHQSFLVQYADYLYVWAAFLNCGVVAVAK